MCMFPKHSAASSVFQDSVFTEMYSLIIPTHLAFYLLVQLCFLILTSTHQRNVMFDGWPLVNFKKNTLSFFFFYYYFFNLISSTLFQIHRWEDNLIFLRGLRVKGDSISLSKTLKTAWFSFHFSLMHYIVSGCTVIGHSMSTIFQDIISICSLDRST